MGAMFMLFLLLVSSIEAAPSSATTIETEPFNNSSSSSSSSSSSGGGGSGGGGSTTVIKAAKADPFISASVAAYAAPKPALGGVEEDKLSPSAVARRLTGSCVLGTFSGSGSEPCATCPANHTTAGPGATSCVEWVAEPAALHSARGLAWGKGGTLGLDPCSSGVINVATPTFMLVSLFPGRTVQLTAGGSHTLALHDDGTVSAFGANNMGQ